MTTEPPVSQGATLIARPGSLAVTGYAPIVKAYNRLPENHEVYALIGQAAAQWAYLDHVLDVAIWDLVGSDNAKVACVTGRVSSPAQRCDAIFGLCKLQSMPKAISDSVNKLRNDIHSVADVRHRLSHDPTFVDQDKEIGQFRSLPRHELVFGMVTVDPQVLKDDISKLAGMVKRADDLRETIFRELAASHGKHP